MFSLYLSTDAAAQSNAATVDEIWHSPYPVTGKSIEFWVKVKNTGDTSLGSTCLIRFYLKGPSYDDYVPASRPCSANDYTESNPKTGVFAPGETRWYKVTYSVPYPGDYTLWAVVLNDGRFISKWSASQRFKVSNPVTSAEVTRLYKVDYAQMGKTVDLWAEVKNTGTLPLGSACSVRFYLRGPSYDRYVPVSRPCTANDDLKSNPNTGDMAVGEKRWFKVQVTIPMSGDYSYWAIVQDSGKDISRWSYEQKFTSETPSYSSRASAELSSVTKDGGSFEGQTIGLWAEVKNTGNIALGSNCLVRFYLLGPDVDGFVGQRSCTENDYLQSNPRTGSLEVGETRWYKVSYRPKTRGTYKLWAIVEKDGNYISRWSSVKSFTISYVNMAAKVTDLYKDGSSSVAEAVGLWARVKNTGNVKLGSTCAVRFYVQGPGIDAYIGQRACTENDWRQDNANTGNLEVGEARWYKVYYQPSEPGNYKFWAIVENPVGQKISRWSAERNFAIT